MLRSLDRDDWLGGGRSNGLGGGWSNGLFFLQILGVLVGAVLQSVPDRSGQSGRRREYVQTVSSSA